MLTVFSPGPFNLAAPILHHLFPLMWSQTLPKPCLPTMPSWEEPRLIYYTCMVAIYVHGKVH